MRRRINILLLLAVAFVTPALAVWLDPAFVPQTDRLSYPTSVRELPGRRLLVLGRVRPELGSRSELLRLLPSGELDATFRPEVATNESVISFDMLPDGRVAVVTHSEGVFPLISSVRLLAEDGSRTLNVGAYDAVQDRIIYQVASLGNDRLWISGSQSGPVRVFADIVTWEGVRVWDFNPPWLGESDRGLELLDSTRDWLLVARYLSGTSAILTLNYEGKLLFQGANLANGTSRVGQDGLGTYFIHRWTTAERDTGELLLGSATQLPLRLLSARPELQSVSSAARDLEGRVYTGSSDSSRPLRRWSADGELDSTFDLGLYDPARMAPPQRMTVGGMLRLANGQILVWGSFQAVEGRPRTGMARLLAEPSAASVRFDATSAMTAAETGESIHLPLFRSGDVTRSAQVLVRPVPERATAGRDFEATPILVTFQPGETSKRVELVIRPDEVGSEVGEDFLVELEPAAQGTEIGVPASLQVVIQDSLAFDPRFALQGSWSNPRISSLIPLEDGSFVLKGSFTELWGAPVTNTAHVLPDGTVDTDFDPATLPLDPPPVASPWPDWTAGRSIRLADGRAVVVVVSTNVPRMVRLIRLNPDGTHDPAFAVAEGVLPDIRFLLASRDGQVLVAGRPGEASSPRLMKLRDDGSADPGFSVHQGRDATILGLSELADSSLLVAEQTRINSQSQYLLRKYQPDGTPDPGFYPPTFACYELSHQAGCQFRLNTLLEAPDGRLLVAGLFDGVNGERRAGLARLWPDGLLDAGFRPPPEVSPTAACPTGGFGWMPRARCLPGARLATATAPAMSRSCGRYPATQSPTRLPF